MKNRKYENGYFTLEAALIYPMVMILTVMMIFLAFYVYDRSVLDHSAYQAALIAASSHEDKNDEIMEKAKETAALLTDKRIFALKELNHGVSVDGGSVTVSYNCIVNMPYKAWLASFTRGLTDEDMTLEISQTAKRLRPAMLIRQSRLLNGMAKRYGDGDGEE
jgi:hypothetical protein